MLNCNQPEVQLDAMNNGPLGAYSYNWIAGNGGNIVSGSDGLSPTVDAEGDYTLYATNLVSGCTDSLMVSVALEAGTPVPSLATPDTLSCTELIITIDGTNSSTGPQFVYNWTAGPGGNILSGADGPSPQVNTPGWYYLELSNSSTGCIAIDSVFVPQDTAAPPVNAGVDGLLTCADTLFQLEGNSGLPSNGLSFNWSIVVPGSILGDPDSSNILTDQAGIYLLSVTDQNNGCVSVDTAVVTADQNDPMVSLPATDTLDCANGTVTVTSVANSQSGMVNYQWSTGNGLILSDSTLQQITVSQPGVYDLLITDPANACTSTASVPVSIDTVLPVPSIALPNVLNCLDTLIALSGNSLPNSNIAISWTTDTGLIVSGGNSLNPQLSEPGTYTLHITNLQNGCIDSASIIVAQNITPPVVDAGVSDTLDCGTVSTALIWYGFRPGGTFLFLAGTKRRQHIVGSEHFTAANKCSRAIYP